jgi:hypothetical protein
LDVKGEEMTKKRRIEQLEYEVEQIKDELRLNKFYEYDYYQSFFPRPIEKTIHISLVVKLILEYLKINLVRTKEIPESIQLKKMEKSK